MKRSEEETWKAEDEHKRATLRGIAWTGDSDSFGAWTKRSEMSRVPHSRETFCADEWSSRAGEDAVVVARSEIVELLATAYRCLKTIRQVGSEQPRSLGEKELMLGTEPCA